MITPNQDSALAQIVKTAQENTDVLGLYIFGSWGTDSADLWSDLDLLAITVHPTEDWLPELGGIFAKELTSDDRGVLKRLVYSHGLSIDLLSVTPESVAKINSWSRIPFSRGLRPLIGGCKDFNDVLAETSSTSHEATKEELQKTLQSTKFVAIQALKKLARGDRLIAEHLALESLQEAMVCAMIAREQGTFNAPV